MFKRERENTKIPISRSCSNLMYKMYIKPPCIRIRKLEYNFFCNPTSLIPIAVAHFSRTPHLLTDHLFLKVRKNSLKFHPLQNNIIRGVDNSTLHCKLKGNLKSWISNIIFWHFLDVHHYRLSGNTHTENLTGRKLLGKFSRMILRGKDLFFPFCLDREK